MIRKISIGILALLLVSAAGFLIYTQVGVYGPLVQGLGQETGIGLHFPGNDEKIIIYPGGKVEYEAYNVLADKLNEKGYDVTLVKMPLNLAVLSPDKAEELEGRVIIGHSLGGAMAAKFAYDHPDRIDALVLLGAYPAASNDLSDRDLLVLSISGSEDGLATPEKIAESKDLLPGDTHYVLIEGGNHAQFGTYGAQKGDLPASISNDEQLDIAVRLIDQLIKEMVK